MKDLTKWQKLLTEAQSDLSLWRDSLASEMPGSYKHGLAERKIPQCERAVETAREEIARLSV